MKSGTWIALAVLLLWGIVRIPVEEHISDKQQTALLRQASLSPELRERLGQSAFIAALGGYRALVASFLWIEAHSAWQDTDWGRMNFLMQNVVALQPRAWIYWDRAAWHMGWNASVSVRRDGDFPREALAQRAERQYFNLAKDFLKRGIENNPERWEMHQALAFFNQEKLRDHCASAEAYERASQFPEAPPHLRRFAAYQLAQCEGMEREAYEKLRGLFLEGEEQHLPTLLTKLKELEKSLEIPPEERLIK